MPGAFIQANQDDLVHVQFTGAMVDKLLEIDEEMYLPYVTWEGNQKVMYEQLLKALYGMVKAANLFRERLTKHLVELWGFTINLNDSCVANKIIKGHQCTVVWHVDDLKISHQMEEVVNELLSGEFGAHSELTMSSGTSHDYLGMTLDLGVCGSQECVGPRGKSMDQVTGDATERAAAEQTSPITHATELLTRDGGDDQHTFFEQDNV